MKSPRVIRIAATLLALTFLLRSPSPAQEHKHSPPQDAASLKLSTDLVSLSVTVTDQKGQPITGLRREDFKVYEDGVEQPLSFFSLTIKIIHRHGFDQPVDDCEQMCLKEIRRKLAEIGAHEGEWREGR